MLKLSLYNYNEVYIFVKGTVTVANKAAADVNGNNTNINVIFKNLKIQN